MLDAKYSPLSALQARSLVHMGVAGQVQIYVDQG